MAVVSLSSTDVARMIAKRAGRTEGFRFRLGAESAAGVRTPDVRGARSEEITGPPIVGSAAGVV